MSKVRQAEIRAAWVDIRAKQREIDALPPDSPSKYEEHRELHHAQSQLVALHQISSTDFESHFSELLSPSLGRAPMEGGDLEKKARVVGMEIFKRRRTLEVEHDFVTFDQSIGLRLKQDEEDEGVTCVRIKEVHNAALEGKVRPNMILHAVNDVSLLGVGLDDATETISIEKERSKRGGVPLTIKLRCEDITRIGSDVTGHQKDITNESQIIVNAMQREIRGLQNGIKALSQENYSIKAQLAAATAQHNNNSNGNGDRLSGGEEAVRAEALRLQEVVRTMQESMAGRDAGVDSHVAILERELRDAREVYRVIH